MVQDCWKAAGSLAASSKSYWRLRLGFRCSWDLGTGELGIQFKNYGVDCELDRSPFGRASPVHFQREWHLSGFYAQISTLIQVKQVLKQQRPSGLSFEPMDLNNAYTDQTFHTHV